MAHTEDKTIDNPELEVLKRNKETSYNWQERRHDAWEQIYTLYRNIPEMNRLTQRQSVTMPLMKRTILSLLKDIDQLAVITFEDLENNVERQTRYNEYWKLTADENNLELKDYTDKKQNLMYGRSHKQIQIIDGKVKIGVLDVYDLLIDRYVDPLDIDATARSMIHQHIFVTLDSLEQNEFYNKQAIERLKEFYGTELGLITARDNQAALERKNERMSDMGVVDVDNPMVGASIVELSQHFVYEYNDGLKKEVIYMKVEADGQEIIMSKPLFEVIGNTDDNYWHNHYPYTSWAIDPERIDIWSDGVGDTIRATNLVLNSWTSQLVENRTMRSFGMNIFDASMKGFNPQMWEAMAWGWYGIPVPTGKKLGDVFQKIDIPDLSESLDEMQFMIEISERSSGATTTQQGAVEKGQTTLGEIDKALVEAKERSQSSVKFDIKDKRELGMKFIKMIEAAGDKLDVVKIFKKGKIGGEKNFSHTIDPVKDLTSKLGTKVKVWSQNDKVAHDSEALQKLQMLKGAMPFNPVVNKVYNKKLSEFADLTPDEVKEVMEFEEKNPGINQGIPGAQPPQATQPGAPPVQPTI